MKKLYDEIIELAEQINKSNSKPEWILIKEDTYNTYFKSIFEGTWNGKVK